jgi:hypothetical protein
MRDAGYSKIYSRDKGSLCILLRSWRMQNSGVRFLLSTWIRDYGANISAHA